MLALRGCTPEEGLEVLNGTLALEVHAMVDDALEAKDCGGRSELLSGVVGLQVDHRQTTRAQRSLGLWVAAVHFFLGCFYSEAEDAKFIHPISVTFLTKIERRLIKKC